MFTWAVLKTLSRPLKKCCSIIRFPYLVRLVQDVRGQTRGSYCSLWRNKRLRYPNAATHQSGLYTLYTFICIYIYTYTYIYIYITYINTISNIYIYTYTNGALNWWVPNRMSFIISQLPIISDLMNPMNQSWWRWLSLPLWKMMDFVSKAPGRKAWWSNHSATSYLKSRLVQRKR